MLRAILAAIVFEARYGSLTDLWYRLSGMLEMIWLSRKTTLPAAVIEARLAACKACPIYCAELGTCGDARNPHFVTAPNQDRRPMGCFCFLKAKARLSAATCWADENGVDPLRWPE